MRGRPRRDGGAGIIGVRGTTNWYYDTTPTDHSEYQMQDRIYRADIAMCAMAYHRPAMLSYCPAATAPSRSRR